MPRTLPDWLKKPSANGILVRETLDILHDLKLNTICESGHCPNWGECYSRKTATFLILGNMCTRQCGFCDVPGGRPGTVDASEPERLAEAVARLNLNHVVITSVNRDDLADGGAFHFVNTIAAVRRRRPEAIIEILTPDFEGNFGAVKRVVEAGPDIYNHNVETVPRLYSKVRPQANYEQSLELLARVKQLTPSLHTKSGIMLGLGETFEEVREVLRALKNRGCEIVTIGQYLRPSPRHLAVERYVPPQEFEEYRKAGLELGLPYVFSAPFVRSSYNAAEVYSDARRRSGAAA